MKHNFTVLCCVHFICLSTAPFVLLYFRLYSQELICVVIGLPCPLASSGFTHSRDLWGKCRETGQREIKIFILLVPSGEVASGWQYPLTKDHCASQGGFSSWFSASGHFFLPWFLGHRYSKQLHFCKVQLPVLSLLIFLHPDYVVICSFVNKPRLSRPDHRGTRISS